LLQAIDLQQKLVADHPAAPDYAWELGASQMNLGILRRDRGDHAGAERAFRDVIATYRNLAGRFPDVPAYRWEQASSEANLGKLLGRYLGRHREAEEAFRRAITIQKKLMGDSPKNPQDLDDLAFYYYWHSRVIHDSGRVPEEKALMEKALRLREKLFKANPGNNRLKGMVAHTCYCVAWLEVVAQGPPWPEAGRAAALAKRAVQLNPKEGASWFVLGIASYRTGNWKDCLAAMERARELRYTHLSRGFFVAMAHWQLGDREKARACYAEAVTFMEKHGPHDPEPLRFRAEAAALLGIQEQLHGKQKESSRSEAK
jgi:tetratricopeptide (TPR) repeat protein